MLYARVEMERAGCWEWKEGDIGHGDGVCGVGVMVKEELCEKVVEVRRVSDDSCCF